jgi:hypothetical protein
MADSWFGEVQVNESIDAKGSPSFIALSKERIRRIASGIRSQWSLKGSPNKAQAFHDVLRLNIVSGAGATPAAYGWHIDSLLNVGLQPALDRRVSPEARSNEEAEAPEERGIVARVYRVPRNRRQPAVRRLEGQLGGAAA